MGKPDPGLERRYELEIEGHLVWADCRQDAGHLIISHVEASPALRGTGAAGRLMVDLVADARATGMRIIPRCGYAAAWLRRHPEHGDMTA